MSALNGIAAHDWPMVAYVIGVVGLCIFMLTVPQLLGGRDRGRAKDQPFESGVVSQGGARLRLSAKFYLVAMFFVIFDVEALFLYAWATSVRESGWAGFVEVLVFILVLLAGLVYIWRIGALDWAPENQIIAKKRAQAARSGAPFDGPINLAEVTRFDGIDELERDPLGKIPAQLGGTVHGMSPGDAAAEPSATPPSPQGSTRA